MNRFVFSALAFVISLLIPGNARAGENPDLAQLLAGVSEISAPGVPGSLGVFGANAFPVVAAGAGKNTRQPVIAAARVGQGRVVAFGHTGYLDPKNLSADTQKFFVNAVRWSAGANDPRVLVIKERALVDFLKSQNIKAEEGELTKLGNARVVIISAHTISEKEGTLLWNFVSKGGGLITASTGWGWAQLNPGKDLKIDLRANSLLTASGIVITQDTVEKTSKDGFATSPPPSEFLHGAHALAAMGDQLSGKTKLANVDATQAAATLTLLAQSLPVTDKTFLPKLAALAKQSPGTPLPSDKKPLKKDDAAARLALTLQIEMMKALPPEQIVAHPAAANFPGSVPPDARVTTRTVEIDTKVPGWHSVGLYAAPGALVKITLPQNAANKKLAVRIGCHTDKLWNLDTWKRVPEITREFPCKQIETRAANAFGGLVYIVVPDKCDLGAINVTIAGAIDAPLFVLGKTTPDGWQKQRALPGPWAELATDKVILTVPSKEIRALENPDALMKFWDSGLDAIADLVGIPHERKRPERIVADEQISAGYMHSGYPIMTHLDAPPGGLNLEKMKSGNWGYWHELGHNHQVGDWTFNGTGEVTNNVMVLYVMETLCGKAPGQGHDAMKPETAAKRLQKYVAEGANFETWKNEPFLALTMYNQLRIGFGWDTFKKIFAEYRALPKSELPKNDDEKRDQWMVRFSRAAGKNLGPFFQAWGIPTSEKARASLADLPAWMPDDFPKSKTAQR